MSLDRFAILKKLSVFAHGDSILTTRIFRDRIFWHNVPTEVKGDREGGEVRFSRGTKNAGYFYVNF